MPRRRRSQRNPVRRETLARRRVQCSIITRSQTTGRRRGQEQPMASLDGTVLVSRARRRPARYSPELSSAAPSSAAATPQQSVASALADMLDNSSGVAALSECTPPTVPVERRHEQQSAGLIAGPNIGDMAPHQGRGRPRSKSKKKGPSKKRQQPPVDISAHNYTKRPRVANVLLENEMLIDEIRTRKALWQRTHEQHHSSTLTAPLWDEVAKILDSTPENIRRRWKSLKDHYRRELKKSMTDATAPPSAWPYYKKMRFMKSQMFVSLRRKNGEDHLEILSDDEEEINNQWNGQGARKQECGLDDGYDMSDEYNEMVKFEQHMQTHDDMDGTQEEEEEEEEDEQPQEEEEQAEEMQEQVEQSVIPPMQDGELPDMQQQQNELTNIATIRQQPVITSDMRATDLVGLPTIVTTTASSLSNRLSGIEQRASNIVQRSERLSSLQQQGDINGDLEDMNTRHSTLQEQHAEINSRLSAIQRNAEIAAIQQRANISAMHERAQMSVLQQRAEMQQRNGVVDNEVDNANVSPLTGDGSISDDYHFFMSLMPHVRHFTSLQKLKVRNRIQQIIIEEASNCQYDPLAN